MQGGTTVRYLLTPIKMSIFKKGVNKYGEQTDVFYSVGEKENTFIMGTVWKFLKI